MTLSSDVRPEATIAELTSLVRSFSTSRGWDQFHDPKNLTMAIAAEAGELAALLRWIRNDESDEVVHSERLRQRLIQEIGDVGILLLLLCARVGVRLDTAIHDKVEHNEKNYPAVRSLNRAERPESS